MKSSKYRIIFRAIMISIFLVASINADLKLVISPYRQWGYNTCWAAVSVMVLQAYGFEEHTDEKQVRCWVYPDPNEQNCNTSMGGPTDKVNGLWGQTKSVDQILQHFGFIYGSPEMDLSQEEIAEEIGVNSSDFHKPFICGLLNANNSRHMVLGIGYRGSGIGGNVTHVIYNNPANKQELTMAYSDFVYNNNFYWLESYCLTSLPNTPIPTPINPPPWAMITSGTGSITPSTTSLTFSGLRSSSASATWSWKLIFPYSGGLCTARTWTVTGSQSTSSTWNISGFSMPTGYNWRYGCDGKVAGWAEVTVTYSSTTLKAGYNVLYVPSNLYPGVIVYQDKVVSTSQPEVKAHEKVVLRNDVFNSGTNIDFKTGGRLDIENGVTITNGSSVDFVVDPPLW